VIQRYLFLAIGIACLAARRPSQPSAPVSACWPRWAAWARRQASVRAGPSGLVLRHRPAGNGAEQAPTANCALHVQSTAPAKTPASRSSACRSRIRLVRLFAIGLLWTLLRRKQ
jgi:hypothetical protein